MQTRSSAIVVILLATALVAGCSEDRTTVYLADIEYQAEDVFTTSHRDTVPNHLHEFVAGFGHMGRDGRWIEGKEAVLHLMATGERIRLEVDCSTTPGLSERGQALTIVWNGYDLGTHPVDKGWQRVMCVGRVPPIAIKDGLNVIELRSSMAQIDSDGRTLSVYIKGVRLIAQFTAAEQADWEALVAAAGDRGE